MCGIVGWYNRDGRPVDVRALTRMTDILVHRGPDDSGVWCEGAIGLGHRRLSIRDLSIAGHQPMADPNGHVIVSYNGELYNERELRSTLEREFGVRFQSTCDTEILPHAYLAWGEAMFGRLEGMFAIAVWDQRAQCLLLARDGIGIKPLYYAESANKIIFGSEVKALLASDCVQPEIEPEGLHCFLAAGYAGPSRSLIRGVRQVPPGVVVAFTSHKCEQRQFWQPVRNPQIDNAETALEMLTSALTEVVGSQLISDVPLGVLQSGGIDSSLVTLALKRGRTTPPLFTASFSERSHDETTLASTVAHRAGLAVRTVAVDTHSDLEGAFRSIVYHFDGQCADTGALGFYLLSAAVRRESAVVLSGDGGDEFFGGYETYQATRVAETARHVIPAKLAGAIGRMGYYASPLDEGRLPRTSLAARFFLGLAEGHKYAHMQWRRLVPGFLARKLYGTAMADLRAKSPYLEYEGIYRNAPGGVLDRALLADQRFHLQSVLTKVDAMSMAHSLEIRVPLLDRRIMDIAGKLDIDLLVPRGRPPKYILRLLAERLGAPTELTSAPKKGFNFPIAHLLRRDLSKLAERTLAKDADVVSPYLKPDAVRNLWREHQAGSADHAYALWPILTLAVWRSGLARPERTIARAAEAAA
jgi:asparagine synthase (glutamine-hydrolysing)